MLNIVFDIDGLTVYDEGFKHVSYIKFNDVLGISMMDDATPLIKTKYGPVLLTMDDGLGIANNIQAEELLQFSENHATETALLMVLDKAIRLWNNNTRFGRKNVADGW